MQRFRKTVIILFIGTVCLVATPNQHAQAAIPIWEIIRQAVVKIIKAVDLMIQRLQNKTIWLQEAQKDLAAAARRDPDNADWPFNQKNAGHVPSPYPDAVMHLTTGTDITSGGYYDGLRPARAHAPAIRGRVSS